ncbi:zinc finger protein 436 [Puntigrus tetrazona]|uniref:zinc finger protein 436 n=1 Tax=Puntigrus tetrazona TaxID=1606681 RepID=UPI001C8A1F64|nr:zinc finger protein 436 [Puntigrus tetrazona]
MSYCSFQAQLVSIMDIVAKAAEAEIKRRVEESCAVIRLELSRSRKDIDALKRKCLLMDSELRRVRGRGRKRVFQCGTPQRFPTPFKTHREITDQDQNPDQTPSVQQPVRSLEEGISSPVIKQESSSSAGENRPLDHEQQDVQQIQALENTENPKPGASEIHISQFPRSQTPAGEPPSASGREPKAEKDDEEPRVHLRFAELWTAFPETAAAAEDTDPGSCSRPAETQAELHEPGRAREEADRAPAFGQKRFCCSFCEKSFSRFGQLKEHLRSHTGEKPFACAQCGRSFTKHCNLIRHAVVHSGEKPYQCAQCGKRFTQRSSLKSHQRTHSSAWHHHS